jgi:Uma2 family endonuclease
MEVLKLRELVSVADYLAGEPISEFRHEYIGGEIHAMAGASEEHNAISLNLATALQSHLKGRRCRAFIHDMKVRLQIAGDDIFYYPDVMVACDPRDTDRYFKRFPTVIVEVLSPETERTDRREKFLSYQQIETLEEYVLVAQDKSEVTVFRRANQWRPEIVRQASDSLTLSSLEFSLALVDLYDGVNLSAVAGHQ